jgi:hypothetical protein
MPAENGNSGKKIPTSISLSEMEIAAIKDIDPAGLTHYIREKLMQDMGRTDGNRSKEFENKYAKHTSALASAILLMTIGVAFGLVGYLLFLVTWIDAFLGLFVIGVIICIIGAVKTYRFKKMVTVSITVENNKPVEESRTWKSSLR